MKPVVIDIDKNVLFPDTSRVWTYDDVKDWGEDVHCEILNGELFMSPTPSFYHQEISGNLYTDMHDFVKAHRLGRIVTAPQDTRLGKFNLLQPDILFISKDNKDVKIEVTVVGPPDLVVEIVSPTSIRRDYHKKKDIYEEFKVKEYWIVDPANKSVEVFTLKNDIYEIFTFGTNPEHIAKSVVLQGFEITLGDIFEE
jgi:Uma2 family endonuclease